MERAEDQKPEQRAQNAMMLSRYSQAQTTVMTTKKEEKETCTVQLMMWVIRNGPRQLSQHCKNTSTNSKKINSQRLK